MVQRYTGLLCHIFSYVNQTMISASRILYHEDSRLYPNDADEKVMYSLVITDAPLDT
jgi:hypothetical protein